MKKRGLIIILVLIILIGLMSTNWFWNKISGKVVEVGIEETEQIPVDCVGEGNTGNMFDEDVCCGDLTQIANAHRANGECLAPTDGSFICAECGNGMCGAGENYCNCRGDCCEEGDTRDYVCPDGTVVEWCGCQDEGIWACVNSPENACPSMTCTSPVCEGVYHTGEYDENGCPIYECPPAECSDVSEDYVCVDGTSVAWCTCENNQWVCRSNPEEQCPTQDQPNGGTETISETVAGGGGGGLMCPEECVCNENTVACAAEEAVVEEACPVGCTCTDDAMVCEVEDVETGEGCAMGCKLDNICVLPGIRTTLEDQKKYCDIDSQWKKQKVKDKECDNNFECKTNLCIDGQCLGSGLWQRILDLFKNLFGG